MRIDPASVILLMSAHLLVCGVLYRFAASRLPRRGGLDDWGSAAILFGGAYLLRLVQGLERIQGPDVLAANVLMQLGVMLLARGFLMQTGLRLPGDLLGSRASLAATWLGLVVAYVGVWIFAPAWEYPVFSLALNVTTLCAGAVALASVRHVDAGARMRVPIALCGTLLLVLGGLGLTRSIAMARHPGPIYETLHAGPFFVVVAVGLITLSYLVMWIAFVDITRALTRLASLDALTGVLNRRGLSEAIARHFRRPGAEPLVLLQIDIDYFKEINDVHGHDAGDQILIEVARLLRQQCRPRDFVARTGGEEFLVGCAGVRPDQAYRLAESLRARIGELRVALESGERIACTVSVGVSTPIERQSGWEAAWREADAALYRAKARGRNRTEAPSTALAAAA
jgi:diguanylate cyclase (GGDEF)-like protein